MTLGELIDVLDEKETLQITLHELKSIPILKEKRNLRLCDYKVKKIKTDGCAMIFAEIGID